MVFKCRFYLVDLRRLVGCIGFNSTLTTKVISLRSVTHMCFFCFLTPVKHIFFFPKPPTTFLTCFCRGKRRKYAGKKSRLNRGSNSQAPGNESDTLTIEPPGRGLDLRRTVISIQWSLKASSLLIQVVSNTGLTKYDFCGICQRECQCEFNTVFLKACNVFCSKPKEVDSIKLNFYMACNTQKGTFEHLRKVSSRISLFSS